MERYGVLIVDDDETIRKLLGRFLDHLGYQVYDAGDTMEAVRRLEQSSVDVVVADVRMPGPDGIELLSWITNHRPETAVVMLSGCEDVRVAVRAMKGGAQDYIVKPFDLSDVADTIGRAIGKQKESIERAKHLIHLESKLDEQSGRLRDTIAHLDEASEDTLEALTSALDARERETQAHSRRVSEYSVHLARELGVTGAEVEVIRQGSMLHDIGKIGIPDRILLKPDGLTPEEWAEMRKHPEIGAWIVSGVESLKAASEIVIAHHERYDGSGYPHGLKGDEIPLGARIFAIADCLDAVLSDRPYRAGQPYEHARDEIALNAGTQFDPRAVECFLRTDPATWEAIRKRTLARAAAALVPA